MARHLCSPMLGLVSDPILDVDELAQEVVKSVLALDSPYQPRRPHHQVKRDVSAAAWRLTEEKLPKGHQFFGSVLHAFVTLVSFLLFATLGFVEGNVSLFILSGILFLISGISLGFAYFPEQQDRRRAKAQKIRDLASEAVQLTSASCSHSSRHSSSSTSEFRPPRRRRNVFSHSLSGLSRLPSAVIFTLVVV